MFKKFKFFFSIIFYNTFILFVFLIFFELFFGYWFDKDNFGASMREHRMKNQKITWEYKGEKINYYYKRNYYGFRGEDIDPSNIKAIIMGGSVIDERYKPDQYTITGFLNQKFKENNRDLKIINAGIEGQSTKGMVENFDNWLYKIKGFKPEIILAYVGANDSLKEFDDNLSESKSQVIDSNKMKLFFDNLKSKSIIYDKIRIFKYKVLSEKKDFIKYDGKPNEYYLKNYNYIKFNYKYLLSEEDKIKLKPFLNRIDLIYEKSQKFNSKLIFIANITSSGFTREIQIINQGLIDHCNIKKYDCIDLAKKLIPSKDFWYDGIHTTKEGSEEVASIIYQELVNILKN